MRGIEQFDIVRELSHIQYGRLKKSTMDQTNKQPLKLVINMREGIFEINWRK